MKENNLVIDTESKTSAQQATLNHAHAEGQACSFCSAPS